MTALADLIVLQVGYQHCVRMNAARCGPISRKDFLEFNRMRWSKGSISRFNRVDRLIERLTPGRLALPEGYSL